MKVRFHYNNPIHFDVDANRDVDVYIDQIIRDKVPAGNVRIIILEEPRKGLLFRLAKRHTQYYSYLLTFHSELLFKNPKARKFLMMKPWVVDYRSPNKKFSVSTVVGGKNHVAMPGYDLRHNLWRQRESITIPREFYLSGNAKHWHSFVPWTEANYEGELVLGASKEPLFDSMFHVAIENISIANYFSEKILDCFQSFTVPVYWGCTNIDRYFNHRGILQARDLNDIINICNSLTPEKYQEMLPAMEDNYERSKTWLNPKEQVETAIKNLLAEI